MFTWEGPHIVMSRTDAQNGLDFHFNVYIFGSYVLPISSITEYLHTEVSLLRENREVVFIKIAGSHVLSNRSKGRPWPLEN
jgi:hypothetical protein